MVRRLLFTSIFGCLLFFSTAGLGQALTYTGNLGGVAGVGFLSNSGGSGFTYGATMNLNMTPHWAVGFLLTSMSPSSTLSPTGTSYSNSLTEVAVDTTLNFTALPEGMRLGFLLGLGLFTTTYPGSSGNTNIVYGPIASYDHSIMGSNFTAGPEVDIFFTTANNGYTNTSLLGTLKYWF